MSWIYLVAAGLLEVVWAFFMKQSAGFTKPVPSLITITTMIASFLLLAQAMRTLPLSTAYMLWTGIGAVGSFLIGVLVIGEPLNTSKIFAAILIIAGLLLLKLTSE